MRRPEISPNLVVDPVMVSSTGDRLLEADAETAYRELLIPHARVLTPNLREAQVLLDRQLTTLEAMCEAAVELGGWGAEVVVVKGGHPTDDMGTTSVDIVWDGTIHRELRHERIVTPNDHGTGCSFASAVASQLALGSPLDDAVDRAKAFVATAIAGAASWTIGAGHGPIDHFGWTAQR